MAEMEAHNQREITQRQRAEALYGSLTCTTYREGYQDPDNDIDIIEQALTTARWEALREAAKVVRAQAGELTRENCSGCGNTDDEAEGASNDALRYAANVLDRLTREGVTG